MRSCQGRLKSGLIRSVVSAKELGIFWRFIAAAIQILIVYEGRELICKALSALDYDATSKRVRAADEAAVRMLTRTSTREPSRLMIETSRSRVKRLKSALRIREKSAAAMPV